MVSPKAKKKPAKAKKADANDGHPVVTLDEAFALAQGHHKSGNYLLAERTYRDILRAVPDHFPTTQFLGVLLFQAGSLDEAKYFLEVACNSAPEDKGCLNNYGGVLTQTGEYEKALDVYSRALVIDPDFTDALNNKSYTLWQLGRLKEAEEISRKVLKLKPQNMVALNNLGIILSKRVKYDESLDVWKQLSEISPDSSMVWSNWSNSLREMGRLQDAVEKGRKAVELDGKNFDALNNLGNALRDLGKIDEAIDLYRTATNLKPEYYQAHVNMAIALADNYRYEEAAVAARYAIAFKNDVAEGYSVLSKSMCETGEYEQAHRAAQRAVHLQPDSIMSYLDLAEVLTRLEQHDDAEAAMQEVLKREPDSPRAYQKLAEIRESTNNYIAAHQAIDTAIKMSPDMPKLWLRKGLIYYTEGEVEKALEMMDKTLSLSPKWAVALQHKAEILISLNRNEEAEKCLREIIARSPELPTAYISLTAVKKIKSEDDPDFVAMKNLVGKVESYGQNMSIGFYYSLSEAYEQLKKYDEAFEYLKKANDFKRKIIPFITRHDVNYHALTKEQYTPQFITNHAKKASASEVPVFIVGMPRSGTTLTEQIISSHPDVFGAGELPEMGQINKLSISGEMTDAKELGDEYVRRIRERDKTGKALRITDKMPANYMYIGLIKSILPNAKIIHCRRNPIDTCLSNYKQNFARGQHWSYNLDEMADAYLRYLDLMDYWRSILPGGFLEIDYEETVSDLPGQARKLIDYIGLPWNDACLEPHKHERPILTASKGQVTQPVYRTSVDKWKIYEQQLQPLVRKLLPEKALP